MRNLPQPPLLVITDRTQASRRIEEVAAACFDGGCRWLSLREKDLPQSERVRLLYRLVALGERYKAAVLVHDDYESALATGAAGVHLSRTGSIAQARRYLGPAALVGISTHSAAAVHSADAQGAHYVTLSPIFASASKPDYGPTLGPDGLTQGVRSAHVPVLALGGIESGNVAAAIEAGATGVAVMGAAMRADDPETMIRGLIVLLSDALAARAAVRP